MTSENIICDAAAQGACDHDDCRPAPLDPARAYRVLDQIQANPEHHHQDTYFSALGVYGDERRDEFRDLASFLDECGTTACFAGWTVLDAGMRLNDHCWLLDQDGDWRGSVEVNAARLLGLTYAERRRLFHCFDNDRVPRVVESIFGPRPEASA